MNEKKETYMNFIKEGFPLIEIKSILKQIPNALSVLRLILTVLLVSTIPSSIAFAGIYIIAGLTDVLDGLIARKLGCESDFGAKLDSIADLAFFSIILFIFINLYFSVLSSTQKAILIAIIFIRMINMALTKLKYKKVVFIHTIANKFSGILVYFIPLILLFVEDGIIIWATLVIVFYSAIEEILITLKYPEAKINRRSIFTE